MLSIRSLFRKKNNSTNVFRITHVEETDSTNAYIRRMLSTPQQGEATPAADQARYWVVTTDFQSSGRGQGTNTWESEKGKNLLFSTIKWPNDIYWKDKKICGILIENTLSGGHIKNCVIGPGIDVNQQTFHSDAPNPVSLCQIVGHEVDREALLQDILKRFDANIQATVNGDYATIVGNYTSWLYRLHGFYPYRDADGDFEAALVEVEDDGHLVLRDREDHIRRYAFKEVEFIINA